MSYLPFALAVWLLVIGLYGVVSSRNFIHLALCLTVMQSSTYVLLLAIGYKHRSTAPVFYGVPVGSRAVDSAPGFIRASDTSTGSSTDVSAGTGSMNAYPAERSCESS